MLREQPLEVPLCDIGEFHDWIGDGTRIGPGGDLPVNTHGGQLAEGRLHEQKKEWDAALEFYEGMESSDSTTHPTTQAA